MFACGRREGQASIADSLALTGGPTSVEMNVSVKEPGNESSTTTLDGVASSTPDADNNRVDRLDRRLPGRGTRNNSPRNIYGAERVLYC